MAKHRPNQRGLLISYAGGLLRMVIWSHIHIFHIRFLIDRAMLPEELRRLGILDSQWQSLFMTHTHTPFELRPQVVLSRQT